MSDEMWTACQAYCARLGRAEYAEFAQKRKRKSERFCPSDYLSDLCRILGQGDEEQFKARRMLEGYASELGL